MKELPSDQPIHFLAFRPDLAGRFRSINEQWIESMFELEASDRALLHDPQKTVIDPGGYIWFAEHPTLGVVGTCALIKKAEGIFELTKMGVLESARGQKIGEQLLAFVLQQANEMRLETVYLLSSVKCEAAIHLYLKHGFEHDADIMQRFAAAYDRCDVAMRWHP